MLPGVRIPDYRFYVNDTRVKPIYNKLNKKYALESNEYFFREDLEGTIKLVGNDFLIVANASIDTVFNFKVVKADADGIYRQYYLGTFSKTDCKFDYDRNICTIKLNKNDRYNPIMNKYEDTIDLIRYGLRTHSVTITKRALVQVYVTNNSRLANFIGGGIYWEQDCESTDSYSRLSSCGFSRNTVLSTLRVCPQGNSTGDLIKLDAVSGLYTGIYDVSRTSASVKGYKITYEFMNSTYRAQIYLDAQTCTIATGIIDGNGNDVSGPFNGIFNKSTGEKEYDIYTKLTLSAEEKALYMSGYLFKLDDKYIAGSTRPRYICVYIPAIEYVYTRLLCDVESVQGISAIKVPTDDIVENNGNYKYAVPYAMPNVFVSYNFTTNESVFGNNSLGQYYLPPYDPYKVFWPINRSYWPDEYSLWFDFSVFYNLVDTASRKQYRLRDGYFIADVIKCILKRIAPDVTHEATTEYSEFLYSSTCPLGLDKFYVFITQKTNILKGEYDRPAQKAEITFKELMEMLYNCFKLRWFIDDENRLRIEHISWFLNGRTYIKDEASTPDIDLTTLHDTHNSKALAVYQNEIEYDKSDLASHFEFSWMDDCTSVFEGIGLDITSGYVDKAKDESINASKFTPDLDYMLAEPSAFSEDGFALICATKSGSNYAVPIVTHTLKDKYSGRAYDVELQNGYASWLYLLKFYMYDLPGPEIEYEYLPAGTLETQGVKRCMQQTVTFPSNEDPSTYALIKTERGIGTINSMSVNLNTRQVEVELNFEPS